MNTPRILIVEDEVLLAMGRDTGQGMATSPGVPPFPSSWRSRRTASASRLMALPHLVA
jgi:hypothetical protein